MLIRFVSVRKTFYVKALVILLLVCLVIVYYNKTNVGQFVSSAERLDAPSGSISRVDFDAEHLKFEEQIRNAERKVVKGLGDNGSPVILTGKEKELGDKDLKKYALNIYLSEKLSYNRTTPDVRSEKCKQYVYNKDLPTASIVVIFFNEPFSVLIRTVWSSINTAPPNTLKEIILVDDSSTNAELGGKLDHYISTRLPKNLVKLIRLPTRLGLIRARLAGARESHGDVLVFLDAHCEAVEGWMEPLLHRIQESPKSVLVPIIDVISADTFKYSNNGDLFQIGGFTWSGHFTWDDIPLSEVRRIHAEEAKILGTDYEEAVKDTSRRGITLPTYSPTMAGGLFAINRKYFWDVGSYDEQMDGWGGENLEMSFRIWQCGGSIETIPCSRVGHIFRDFHPYKFPNDKDTHAINTARLARVWMDEFADLFFLNRPEMENYPGIGDLTHRIVLREKLKCKPFRWYLENIYSYKFIPNENVEAYGMLSAKVNNLCLDSLQRNSDEPYALGVYVCHDKLVSSQLISLTLEGVLRTETSCADVQVSPDEAEHRITMVPCTEDGKDQTWEITNDNQIKNVNTGLCLDAKDLSSGDNAYVTYCEDSITQQWSFVLKGWPKSKANSPRETENEI